jgi:hypothetical protein
MCQLFNSSDRMWEIRCQPYDIISFSRHARSAKKSIGKVMGVRTIKEQGSMYVVYEVVGLDFSEEIDNKYDPRPAPAEIAAEFKASHRRGLGK